MLTSTDEAKPSSESSAAKTGTSHPESSNPAVRDRSWGAWEWGRWTCQPRLYRRASMADSPRRLPPVHAVSIRMHANQKTGLTLEVGDFIPEN